MAGAPESQRDAWGRPSPSPLPKLPRVAAMSRTEAWVWVVLRGFVFVPGILLALVLFVSLGFGGFNIVVVYAQLAMIPAAVVCWIQASAGRGGDRWTLGYVAVWVAELTLIWLGSLVL
jgi:hypothetical protein